MSLYTIYLKFIAKYLFKYWVVRLTRISVEKMNGIFTFGAIRLCSITLWYHTYTQHDQRRHKWGRDFSTSNQVFCINSEYLAIHGFGSTKCLRANRCIAAGHFRKHWKGPADVDANLPLRDKLNQTDGQTVKTKCSSSLCLCCAPLHGTSTQLWRGLLSRHLIS